MSPYEGLRKERVPSPWEIQPPKFPISSDALLVWGRRCNLLLINAKVQLLKCQRGETAFVSSLDNTSHPLKGMGFYISDLSVYGKTDWSIAHSSKVFRDNCDW